MSEGDDTEREHEPTQKRLEDARKRGDVPRSPDLNSAAVYAGLILALFAMGNAAIQRAGSAGMTLLGQADRLAPQFMQSASAPTAGLLVDFAVPFLPLLILPMVAVLLCMVAQRSLIFSVENLELK